MGSLDCASRLGHWQHANALLLRSVGLATVSSLLVAKSISLSTNHIFCTGALEEGLRCCQLLNRDVDYWSRCCTLSRRSTSPSFGNTPLSGRGSSKLCAALRI